MKSPYLNRKFASYWNDRVGKKGEAYRTHVLNPIMFKVLGKLENKIVLELGCGNGYLANTFIHKKAKKVYLLDKSPHNIQFAQEQTKDERVKFVCADVMKSWPVKESVDVIYSSMLFVEVADIKKPFTQAYKKLKKGGSFIFSVVHPAWDLYYFALDTHGIKQDKVHGLKGYFTRGWAKFVMYVDPISGPSLSHKYGKENFLVPHYHRTIEDYFKTLIEVGFKVTNILEPKQTAYMMKNFPKINSDRPLALVFKAVKI